MSDLFGSVKMAELSPVWERVSSVILLFVGMCLSIFPFDVSPVGSVQYTCPVVPLCIVDASLSHYVGN